MAKIGLQNFLYGILTEGQNGTATYGAGLKPGKAISCNVSVSNNDAKLYADDALAESDTTFQSGTISLVVDNTDITTQATLLGHTETDGEMVKVATDIAPYVGLGRIVTKIVNGAYQYKVEFLSKVKFSEPSQEENTRGESVEFGTTTLEGIVATLPDGTWSKSQTFETMAEAKTYLNGLFGTTQGGH